jgi:beta-aspartyl-peptidase (threonine type)
VRAALAIAVLVAACAPRAFTPVDDQAIRAVITAQAAAWNRGDLAGYMAGYAKSPELVFTSGGQIRRGWQETFDRYRARYGGDASTMGHLDFELLQIQPLGADGAIVLGRWKLDGPAAGAGVFSLALRRGPDGWRVVHDHTSLDAKP